MNETLMPIGPGYKKKFNYTQFSNDNHVNMIPEKDFQSLVIDTFSTITEILRQSYGPYGSSVIIADQNTMSSTKDGYNIYKAIGFSMHYKKMVYLTIKNICERVNRNVGDGTTSCILLAEKIFNNVLELIKSPEDKRKLLKILETIEKNLEDVNLVKEELKTNTTPIKPLTADSLINITKMASNYDEDLPEILNKAFAPTFDESGKVVKVKNVVPEINIDFENREKPRYEIDYLPGDYRARVHMDKDIAAALFYEPMNVKVLLYDKTFNEADWKQLELIKHEYESKLRSPELTEEELVEYQNKIKKYDEEIVLIIAKKLDPQWMESRYVNYLAQKARAKKPVNFILAEIRGGYLRDELKDLAAVFGTKLRNMHSDVPNLDECSQPSISIYKDNALCVHNAKIPTEYVEKLITERDAEDSASYMRNKTYNDRINALQMKSEDTLITITSSSSLDAKFIGDKIDDCVAITKSAIDNGTVPNMLWYANWRLNQLICGSQLEGVIVKAISHSIKGLFDDVWESKYGEGSSKSDEANTKRSVFYDKTSAESFDIVEENFINTADLPTSTQYDLEVVVAAISIVKYLLTSRALIFDSFLMKPQGDEGQYVQDEDYYM